MMRQQHHLRGNLLSPVTHHFSFLIGGDVAQRQQIISSECKDKPTGLVIGIQHALARTIND
jgi:hypothetical protein